MIKIKEIKYPDGKIMENLNLISEAITVSRMGKCDWDSLEKQDEDPSISFELMNCLFTLTSLLEMTDESGNKIDTGQLKVGQMLEYMGEEYEVRGTDDSEALFQYVLKRTKELDDTLKANGVN